MGTLDHYTTTEKLEKKFSRKEKEDLTQELVQKMTEMEDKKDDLKAKTASIKDDITTLEKDIKRLTRCVRTGSEMQQIEVEVTKDYEKGEKRFMRLDTNEVYKTVPMDYSELTEGRQKAITFDDGPEGTDEVTDTETSETEGRE